eukprot:CAMPEP_0172679042 /NCGR_PEP_ID=MMETSP1074-20121228/15801_1 /TAXON_ID=2916 /ORGANISM="Ceratium fusus, Strain PA161109" /LENGTH=40 /DNA_ID= /DNA_START= /DNA_END= /DNA_ORIENTATION=
MVFSASLSLTDAFAAMKPSTTMAKKKFRRMKKMRTTNVMA